MTTGKSSKTKTEPRTSGERPAPRGILISQPCGENLSKSKRKRLNTPQTIASQTQKKNMVKPHG